MTMVKIERGLDALPALLGFEGTRVDFQLLEHELLQQRRIPEPAAIVLFEQVAPP